MTGHSLVEESEVEKNYPIFTVSAPGSKLKVQGKVRLGVDLQPPFYSLARLTLIECDMAFTLHLASTRLRSTQIDGSTLPCKQPLSEEAVYAQLVSHLKEMNYTVSSLSKSTPD